MAAAGGSGSFSSSNFPLPSWVMLDRYTFKSLDLASWKEDETTSPLCHTSSGDPFRVSFRFVAPPAVSRFCLHVTGGNLSENCHTTCRILASHRNALLFCLFVPLPVPVEYLSNPKNAPFPRLAKQDLFVYIAGDTPSLQLLPPCPYPYNDGFEDELAAEKIYNPLAKVLQFSTNAEALGVLCDDGGHYIVAYLCVSRAVEAHLSLYLSSDSTWLFYALPILCEDKDLDALTSWSTYRTVAFETCLCWIDYKCGILFCDMAEDHLKVTYLSLPLDYCLATNVPMSNFRSISIVQDGDISKLMFVDVRPSCGYDSPKCSDGFEINVWSLLLEDDKMKWKHEHGFVLRIPTTHGPLTIPIVSMEDPHIAYFVAGEVGHLVKKVWLVPVDLINRSVKYLLPFDDELPIDDADMPRRRRQGLAPFLSSEITKFFQKIAGDSTAMMEAPDACPNYIQVCSLETSVREKGLAQRTNVLEANVGWFSSEESMECSQEIIPRIVFPQCVTGDNQSNGFQQVSFRLLCPNHLVGSLIGRRGLIIRGIEYDTGVCIDIGACIKGCSERVVTIAAMESPGQCPKVQGALVCIFGKMVEVKMNARSVFDKASECSARALVHEGQVDYLTGLGGDAIKEMQKMSRAKIKILGRRDLPACASHCERVLQIAGNQLSVSYALCLISSKLRNQIFYPNSTNNTVAHQLVF